MNPNETPGGIPPLIISIIGAILSIMPFKDVVSVTAGIGAIIAAIFSIRNSYFSTKVSKKKLEDDDKEMDSK